MDVTEVFGFIKDFGFPVVLSWFLLVRMENKLAGLTDVIAELSCNIAALRGEAREK
ncbi:MAG: YvrJ family protein [Acidaminococcaceae bacterium]|nr:YvrJ family protein [Acidaminococcaceae bacterium]